MAKNSYTYEIYSLWDLISHFTFTWGNDLYNIRQSFTNHTFKTTVTWNKVHETCKYMSNVWEYWCDNEQTSHCTIYTTALHKVWLALHVTEYNMCMIPNNMMCKLLLPISFSCISFNIQCTLESQSLWALIFGFSYLCAHPF
jgi:hypothetical protein